ncbi:helix-turn-helix domain-containing protein [Sphingobacteriales bacterium CHB3]|nr:helix-turn-helix domain-containing protein [Sphingobacteriales bacterium CHB3]
MRNKLKMLREAKGFSREELGERLGVSRQTINPENE